MADTEVKIGDKVINENTKVSLNLKTLSWILGILITVISTLFTVAYFDIKKELKETKTLFENQKDDFTGDMMQRLEDTFEKLDVKDEKFLEDIAEIKGDIKVILDRTSTYRYNNTPVSPMIVPDEPLDIELPD